MAHRVKCKVCLSCMAPFWIIPARYYYCEVCDVYYGGVDDDLVVVPKDQINAELKRNQENAR